MVELSSLENMAESGYRLELDQIQFTLEIKHCLMTKSQISQGPSEHQQKRTTGLWSGSSRIPWDTRNSAMRPTTSGNDGALSVWSYARAVRLWRSRMNQAQT